VTETVGRSDLNRPARCRRSGPNVFDFMPKNVTKSCTVWLEAVVLSSAGGHSRLLFLDHSVWTSCLDSVIADIQHSAYLV